MAQDLRELVSADKLTNVDLESAIVMLWSLQGDKIIAASKPALRLFNTFSADELTGRRFGPALRSTVRIAELGRFMTTEDPPRVERLRLALGMHIEVITCLCQRVKITSWRDTEQEALLMIAKNKVEPAHHTISNDNPVMVVPHAIPEIVNPVAYKQRVSADTLTVKTLPNSLVRFIFETGVDGRLQSVSPQLTLALRIKPNALIGQNFDEISLNFNVKGTENLTRYLANPKTWQGITLLWPVSNEGVSKIIPVELSGLPIFSQTREFMGFKGFGLIRLDQAVQDMAMQDIDLPIAMVQDLKNMPETVLPPTPSLNRANLIHQELKDIQAERAERLSQSERSAFREIARALGASLPNHNQRETAASSTMPVEVKKNTDNQGGFENPDDMTAWNNDVDGLNSSLAQPATPPVATINPARIHLAVRQPTKTDSKIPLEYTLLDRLPIGVLITREDKALFLNKTLLDFLDYEDLHEFNTEGALQNLFEGAHPDYPKTSLKNDNSKDDDVDYQVIGLRARNDEIFPVAAHLQTIEFNAAPATMFSFRRTQNPILKEPVAATQNTIKDAESLRPKQLQIVTSSPNNPQEKDTVSGQQGQREAERERDEMRAVLDTATDGVISLDSEGRIVGVNRSAEALFGINQNDVVGERFSSILAGDSHAAAMDYFEGVKSGGVASVLNDGREVVGREKKGGRIPLFMTLGRISDHGTGKFCAVLRDLTAWKKAEAELTESRRVAERASAMKSDFLAKISHEIRTPMNAIIGFAEVMQTEQLGPIGHERYKEYLGDIHRSGGYVVSLVNDLLDLSKIEAGQAELSFTSVNINSIVQDCVSMMQPQATRERVIIRTSIMDKLPEIVADARSIKQVVLNLLSNATKFNKPGGQVVISTALNDEGEAVIRVRDTGIGMSDKEMDAAMQPFRQVSITKRGGGTGLGLPLSKALIEANRASLIIKSTPQQGTLAEVVFPATRVLAE